MPDDILDAAQKQINDAAQLLTPPPSVDALPPPPEKPPEVPPPPTPTPPVTPTDAPTPTESALVDTIIHESESAKTVGSGRLPDPITPPPEPATPPVVPPPPKKKSAGKGFVTAILFLLLLTVPIAVYYISQTKQLADIRNRAALVCGGYPPVTCSNGSQACKLSQCPPPSSCGPAGKSCNDVSNCGTGCSTQNWVCVGVSGQKTCQQHGPEDQCPGGGACTKVNAYRCDGLDSGGQCHQNLRTDVGDFAAGRTHAAGCGQVDQVCRGGSRDNLGCGSFEIVNSTCGTTTTTPPTPPPGGTPQPTPQPTTPPPGPTVTPTPVVLQCTRIRVYKNNAQVDPTTLLPGDAVVLAVAGSNATKGRIRVNGSVWTESTTLNSSSEYTAPFTVPTGITSFTVEAEVFNNGVWQ
ncbi:MAG: hypothetical protein AAB457_00705 [Patescibacteria group bacterium]